MSRIGRKPIPIPDGVKVAIDGNVVRAEGPKGKLTQPLCVGMTAKVEGKVLTIERGDDSRTQRSLHGLNRSLVANMVHGVKAGYERKLEIVGIGYRAQVQGKNIQFQLGFSHDVTLAIPEGVTVTIEKNTQIVAKGADRNKLGQFCAEIRALKPPEPYKGKGIKYKSETILRKEGKKK